MIKQGHIYITKDNNNYFHKIKILEVTKTTYYIHNLDTNAKYRCGIKKFNSNYNVEEDVLTKVFDEMTDKELEEIINEVESENQNVIDNADFFYGKEDCGNNSEYDLSCEENWLFGRKEMILFAENYYKYKCPQTTKIN